jgi:hypothetical protein
VIEDRCFEPPATRTATWSHGSFIEALELRGSFYDDGTDAQQGLFHVDRLSGDGRDWSAIVEPNGFRLSLASNLLTVSADLGVAFFWNINAVMRVVKVGHGALIADFDPLIDLDQIPDEGQDLGPLVIATLWTTKTGDRTSLLRRSLGREGRWPFRRWRREEQPRWSGDSPSGEAGANGRGDRRLPLVIDEGSLGLA